MKMNNLFNRNMSVEQKDKFTQAMKEVDWRNPDERYAVAVEIIKFVKEDVYRDDIVSLIAQVENFNEGESLEFHVLRELIAYIVEPGGFANRVTPIKDVVTLPTQEVNVAIELNISQLRSGRWGQIEDFRGKAAEALLGRKNKLVWDTVFGTIGVDTTAGNYATFASGDSAATKRSALDTALSYVHDNTNEGPRAIIARYTALEWLQDLGTTYFSDTIRDSINNTGFLGLYKGTPIIRLRSYQDENAVQMINANHIMVIGNSNIKFGIVNPGLEVEESYEGTKNRNWTIAFWEKYGCAVVEPSKMYHLEIS